MVTAGMDSRRQLGSHQIAKTFETYIYHSYLDSVAGESYAMPLRRI